jgi:hypothetical protein
MNELSQENVARLRTLCPVLGAAGLETTPAADRAPRGRILKLKLGFNPNSSSVGTTVIVLLWTIVGSSAVLALAAAVLAHRFGRSDEPK